MLYQLWHIKELDQLSSHDPPIDVDGLSSAIYKLLSRSHGHQVVIFIDNLDRVCDLSTFDYKLHPTGSRKTIISMVTSETVRKR